ncbi:hypothetical protein B296_00023974 [Ensete ventricosum]|uniref:Uncharacterized protein n=1 Tax=Ensete ventricosum TaxID=4639 RepID=A0A426Y461_ENSVE|nr:hypothetical protein B296_00023974 [Ensete ventricosum]
MPTTPSLVADAVTYNYTTTDHCSPFLASHCHLLLLPTDNCRRWLPTLPSAATSAALDSLTTIASIGHTRCLLPCLLFILSHCCSQANRPSTNLGDAASNRAINAILASLFPCSNRFLSLPPPLFPSQHTTPLGNLGDVAPSRATTTSYSLPTLIATTATIVLLCWPHPFLLAAAQPPLLSLSSSFLSPPQPHPRQLMHIPLICYSD